MPFRIYAHRPELAPPDVNEIPVLITCHASEPLTIKISPAWWMVLRVDHGCPLAAPGSGAALNVAAVVKVPMEPRPQVAPC